MLRSTHQKLGFTIVELIVVITIIGLLTAIGIMAWGGLRNRAISTKVTNSLTAYVNAFTLYGNEEGHYPPVPHNDNYCLGKSSVPAQAANTAAPSAGLPTTIKGEPARYCGMFDSNDTSNIWASYPPLDKELGTISQVNDSLESEDKGYLVNNSYGGIFASYTDLDSDSHTSEVIINAFYSRNDRCPSGITGAQGAGEYELGSEELPFKICRYVLNKHYPVVYTNETWPPY